MSNSDQSEDDNHSRKRHWLAEVDEETEQPTEPSIPTKSFRGLLWTPFTHLYGMFSKKSKREVHTPEYDDKVENDEIILESTSSVPKEASGPIIFLNEDSPERSAAGSEEVVIEKHIQKCVEISDDSEPDYVQEVQIGNERLLETSFEKQENDEPDILFEKVVKTPNRELQEARRFQDELIYLNETQDSSNDGSVTSSSRHNVDSPTPDDSASRPITPNLFMSPNNYSSNSIRDYWRRPSAKKTTANKRTTFKQDMRIATSISRLSFGVQKSNKSKKPDLSSRDRLLQGVFASGQYDVKELFDLSDKKLPGKKKQLMSTSDVISRASNKINELGGSRSNTPSISRESSVIFEGTSRNQRTPSVSSVHSTETPQKLQDLIALIDNLGVGSVHRGRQRYEHAYETSKLQEDALLEEARIRQGHRAETKGDRLEAKRKDLAVRGIFQRPKVDKKVDDFIELPVESDRIVERAWNKMMNGEELFIDAFNIPICRKDLETLSGLQWLNDNVINFYLQLICDRSSRDSKYPKVYAFNTFFYSNIISKGYASVKRWTRKVDIFSHDVILVPVHLGMHWCMAVIDMTERKLEFYDSLYDGNTAVLPALKSYIADESMDKKKTAFDFSGWTIRQMEKIPRQQNGSDCGVFSCQFGEWASRRTSPRFTQKNMPYYRKRMVYEIVSKKLLSVI